MPAAVIHLETVSDESWFFAQAFEVTVARKVLIIDDAAVLHRLVTTVLSEDHIEVFGALSGVQGIRAAQEIHPDLILLDVMMPGLTGYETCELLSELPETARTPIVFLSGEDETADRVRGLDLGASDYISKPFEIDELRARVRAQLRREVPADPKIWNDEHDALTGLGNRDYFDRRLKVELALAKCENKQMSVIMAGIDRLTTINETFGRVTGDGLLCAVGGTFDENRQRDDVVCRFREDEFAIICPDTDSTTAMVLAEKFRTAVESLNTLGPDGTAKVTCSFGVASGPPHLILLMNARNALAEAKRQGRNRIVAPEAPVCNA